MWHQLGFDSQVRGQVKMITPENATYGMLVQLDQTSISYHNEYKKERIVGEFMRFCTCGCKQPFIYWPLINSEEIEDYLLIIPLNEKP